MEVSGAILVETDRKDHCLKYEISQLDRIRVVSPSWFKYLVLGFYSHSIFLAFVIFYPYWGFPH